MGRRVSVKTKIKQGRGIIDLEHPENYIPWNKVREFTDCLGHRYIVPDLKYSKRSIHLFSNLEKDVYYYLRKHEAVEELFEQVPLEINLTKSICERLNIEHPRIPYTDELAVMTTDFVARVTFENACVYQAIAVKTSDQLNDARILNKLYVEQEYWKEKGISWSFITEEHVMHIG